MSNEEIVPVRHGALSAFGTKTGEAVSGGVRTGVKSALYWIAGAAAIGAVVGVLVAFPGILGVAGALPGLPAAVTSAAAWIVGLGAVGAIIGTVTSPFVGVLGGLFGLGKGYQQGRERVNMERGAAQMMDMEITNAQMQMMAAAQQPRQTGTPAQGTRYNQAASTVQADSAARDGIIAEQQRHRA
jgi:hypothetical protein